jgi:phosphatidylinositol dimannoside acyltransferase
MAQGRREEARPRSAQRAGAAAGVAYAPHRRSRSSGASRIVGRARERSVVRAYRVASGALSRLTPRVSLPVARALFLGGYYAWPEKRRIVRANAAHVLGRPADDPEVGLLARRIFATYSRFAVELMRLPGRPADEPARLMRAEGDRGGESFIDLFERTRAARRGMIVVSGHIGSIDILAGAFAARGMPTYGVADDSAYPELFELLNAQRRRWGVRVIPWRNLREMFRVLRDAGILGLVVDWGYRADDLPVRLFGSWTTLPAGPAVLAAKTGAMIVPVVCRRRADGTFDARHGEPIEPADASPRELLRATQAVADALEAMVAEAPEQWYTFKPMWPSTDEEAAQLEARAREMAIG